MNTCMICALPTKNESRYHQQCLKALFGSKKIPRLEITFTELAELAKKSVIERVTIPGVQSKLSLDIERTTNETDKLTIVGLWGRYILKPPSQIWLELPENEHCTMLMARAAGIETVPFGLIHLASGETAYITKRIDRSDEGEKFAMEDMCQLAGRLTEDKYKGSHEKIAKVIKRFSANPLFDITRYYELILFCYLTGNGDMHLKNFSLFKDPMLGWKLSPAYDLLSTRLVIPASKDPEQLALTIAGKKNTINRKIFIEFGSTIGLNRKQIENTLSRLLSNKDEFEAIINRSFLSDSFKEEYQKLMQRRLDVLKE